MKASSNFQISGNAFGKIQGISNIFPSDPANEDTVLFLKNPDVETHAKYQNNYGRVQDSTKSHINHFRNGHQHNKNDATHNHDMKNVLAGSPIRG